MGSGFLAVDKHLGIDPRDLGSGTFTLLLRGANSDLLLKDTALAMTQRGVKAQLVEFAGIGHAPMLQSEDQIAVVRDFLLS